MLLIRGLASEITTLFLALFLALIIWTAAVRVNDPITTKSLELEITEAGFLISEGNVAMEPNMVRIFIEGPRSAVDPLRSRDFTAFIDLSEVSFGESEVSVNIEHDIDQIEITQEPLVVTVTAEEIIDREIPVEVDINGSAARGHVLGTAVTDPPTILVTGSASRVNQLARAEISIFVDNEREDIVQVRRPVFQSQDGRTASISGLTLSTEEIIVTIPVEELAGVAEKPIIVDWTGSPAPGYRILNVQAEPNSILVSGAPATLNEINNIRTETVDISGLNASFEERVSLNLPEGVELDEIQPVVVSFEILPIRSTAVVQRTPEIRALGEGLTAEIEVDQITITLFGPIPVLDSIQESDVTVTLDLLDVPTGTHSIEPIVNVLAGDLEVRSYQPEFVTVFITNTVSLTPTTPLSPTVTPTATVPADTGGSNGRLPAGGWASSPASEQTVTIYRSHTTHIMRPIRERIL